MKAALWISVGVVFYAYIGYPLLMWAFARWLKRRSAVAPISPGVSIVLAVRNGMAHLPWKISHLFNLDYPNIKEIIVVSDGSTDGTAEFLGSLSDPRLKTILLAEHCGKAVALNAGMKTATADVLLFVDLRARIAPGAIQKLVSRFADPTVGCVAGELVLVEDKQNPVSGAVGGLYWRYEQWIRKCEASYDSPVGVCGCFYAIRRALAVQQPAGMILDDMFQPLSIIRQGYRSVIEPGAQVFDTQPAQASAEFQRKVRTLAGNFQLLQMAPWVLTPQNRVFFQLVSHKILRLFVPYLFVSALLTSILLAGGSHFYAALAGMQLLVLLLALVSLRTNIPVLSRVGAPIAALLMLNTAAVVGLYRFLATPGPLWRIWEANRTPAAGNTSDTQQPPSSRDHPTEETQVEDTQEAREVS
jgi:cellulose synthase/poly-beta-1,6-N-acetylglucosamine synthase-like glycosyltransferase